MLRFATTLETRALRSLLAQPLEQRGMKHRGGPSSDEMPSGREAPDPDGAATAGGKWTSGAKRQRLLAPSPPGRPASGSSSAARGGRGGAASYKEPGPGRIQLPGGGELLYATDLLGAPEAAALFEQLRRELPWEQRSVRVMGRTVPQPRLIAYQADGPELQACGLSLMAGTRALLFGRRGWMCRGTPAAGRSAPPQKVLMPPR